MTPWHARCSTLLGAEQNDMTTWYPSWWDDSHGGSWARVMEAVETPYPDLRAWRPARPAAPRPALRALCHASSIALIATSSFRLDGCQAITGIVGVGVGFGVLSVVTIVAVIGGVLAIVLRK